MFLMKPGKINFFQKLFFKLEKSVYICETKQGNRYIKNK
jgi:hypothetical protein